MLPCRLLLILRAIDRKASKSGGLARPRRLAPVPQRVERGVVVERRVVVVQLARAALEPQLQRRQVALLGEVMPRVGHVMLVYALLLLVWSVLGVQLLGGRGAGELSLIHI